MGTRAMVLRDVGGFYRMYYRHLDGYPTGLGVKLIEALRSPFIKSWEELVKECDLEPEARTVSKPEEAFLNVQGDLEYLYVVKEKPTSLTIYRTSNPYQIPDFVFPIWFSYVQYFPAPHDTLTKMAEIEQTAIITLHAIEQYHKALNKQNHNPF